MFDSIDDALIELKQGKAIIVCDDDTRENEGDLVALAEFITPDTVNFMISSARGLVCAPISQKIADRLELTPMVVLNKDRMLTAFSISIDHISSTTGISAAERAQTLQALANPTSKAADFNRPGHIFPLIAKDGGVIIRNGHTEASVDLAKLCGSYEAGVICEIIKDDGTMARVPDLIKFKQHHNLKMIHIQDLIAYRKSNQNWMIKQAKATLPTKYGEFNISTYINQYTKQETILLHHQELNNDTPLVRIHSRCATGDLFHSLRCDCGEQLEKSLHEIAKYGGYLFYLDQEGRGIGLSEKLKAYNLQDQGLNTIEANIKLGHASDSRDYYEVAQILKQLGITVIQLISNNPDKAQQLIKYGISIPQQLQLASSSNKYNQEYLNTKINKMGHNITFNNKEQS